MLPLSLSLSFCWWLSLPSTFFHVSLLYLQKIKNTWRHLTHRLAWRVKKSKRYFVIIGKTLLPPKIIIIIISIRWLRIHHPSIHPSIHLSIQKKMVMVWRWGKGESEKKRWHMRDENAHCNIMQELKSYSEHINIIIIIIHYPLSKQC